MAIDVAQCSVRLVYERPTCNDSSQTFILSAGGRLRIGRHADCDYVLDVEGVSSVHAELFLQHANAGQDPLVVRDKSKNGTGMRPGPSLTDRWFMGIAPAWEMLKRGGSRTLDHGWQLLMPLKADSGKTIYAVTIYLDNKLDAAEVRELDGERCNSTELKQAEELREVMRKPTLVEINSSPPSPPRPPTPEPSSPPTPESPPSPPIPEMDAPPIPSMDAPPLPPDIDAPPLPPGEPGPPLPGMAPPPPPDMDAPPLPPGAPPPPPPDFAPPLPSECPPPPPSNAPPLQFGEPPPPPPTSMNAAQNSSHYGTSLLPGLLQHGQHSPVVYDNAALLFQARFGNMPAGTFFPPHMAQAVAPPPSPSLKGAGVPTASVPAREMDWDQLEREVDREPKIRRRF
mmetsp:Transcript_68642/g.107333  ORF Transcript_68642/g.107333 Transcript_68642/m.107333 type:complete len:398 (-) Transcript_68642:110-1303(-)